MKTYFYKSLFFAAIAAVSFTGCDDKNVYDAPDLSGLCTTATPTVTVSDVYARTTPSSTGQGTVSQYPDQDDILEAYVVSSDQGGTFYKSFSLQTLDGSRAFSIPVDMYNIYTQFEPGRKVYVYLKNLYIAQNYGSLVIGSLYNDPSTPTVDQVGRMFPLQFSQNVKASCEKVSEEDLVQTVTISQLKNDAYLNKLVDIENVQFSDDSFTNDKTYYQNQRDLGGATNLNVVDADGASLIFRTSSFAKFAANRIPRGNGKIRGILTKYNSDYQFLVRTEADVQLTNPRTVPVFEESFTSNFPNWVKFSVLGAQVWTLDTQYGNPGSCAKMSGYSGGNLLNEDWLISPAIDLTGKTEATLSFDTATRFAGNALQIYISTNYSGTGTPVGATWTQINGATLSPSTGNYVWTASGALDISAFAGQSIRVAYKYTSTTSAAATWEVDNVKVVAN